MAEAFLDKSTSTLTEAKESVTTTAESVDSSLTDAEKTASASTETARSSLTEAEKTVADTTETVKTETSTASEKVSTQAKDVVEKALSKGIEGARSLLQNFEQKRTEVSSKIVGAVTNVVGGGSSSTVASRDIPGSIDNQPLLASERGVETTPWWKNCCGVLDLLKSSSTTTTTTK